MKWSAYLAVGIVLIYSAERGGPSLFAHGAVHEQIVALTREMEKNPKDGELYLRRAELYRVHRSWDEALADYDEAARLNPELQGVHLGRAKMLLEADWPKSASRSADLFLQKMPNHPEGLVIRARSRVKMKEYQAAADDYALAIKQPYGDKPENFIERAQALDLAFPDNPDKAIDALEEGIAKLGPLVTLQLPAIDLEVKSGRFDSALKRVDTLMKGTPRKEMYLTQKGEILLKAGRVEEARIQFTAALQAIESLPPARRHVRAIAALEQKIREHLDQKIK